MDPAPQEQARRSCPKHGVVLDPLGQCVICRRAAGDVGADPSGLRGAVTVLVMLALAIAGAGVYRGSAAPSRPIEADPTAQAPAPPETAQPPDEDALSATQEQARAARKGREVEAQKAAVEKEILRVPIRLYTAKRCDLCRSAKEFLDGKGLEHTDIDVDESAEGLEALGALNPQRSVPTLVVGDEVIVGFGPSAVMVAIHRAATKKVR